MKFVGSKNRHARELLQIILPKRRFGQYYVEPFVGGFNLIDKVMGPRIAGDINPYLIALFRAIQSGWRPPVVLSEEEYSRIRDNRKKYPPYLVGFVGFGCSYSGKWWGGYARGKNLRGEERNYCLESRRNILRQKKGIEGIKMFVSDYKQLDIPKRSLIYCDPPYEGTTEYRDRIDHSEFWGWVREMSRLGHTVFVSEYKAPPDMVCVWSKTVNNTLVKDTGSKRGTEKLFTPSIKGVTS